VRRVKKKRGGRCPKSCFAKRLFGGGGTGIRLVKIKIGRGKKAGGSKRYRPLKTSGMSTKRIDEGKFVKRKNVLSGGEKKRVCKGGKSRGNEKRQGGNPRTSVTSKAKSQVKYPGP